MRPALPLSEREGKNVERAFLTAASASRTWARAAARSGRLASASSMDRSTCLDHGFERDVLGKTFGDLEWNGGRESHRAGQGAVEGLDEPARRHELEVDRRQGRFGLENVGDGGHAGPMAVVRGVIVGLCAFAARLLGFEEGPGGEILIVDVFDPEDDVLQDRVLGPVGRFERQPGRPDIGLPPPEIEDQEVEAGRRRQRRLVDDELAPGEDRLLFGARERRGDRGEVGAQGNAHGRGGGPGRVPGRARLRVVGEADVDDVRQGPHPSRSLELGGDRRGGNGLGRLRLPGRRSPRPRGRIRRTSREAAHRRARGQDGRGQKGRGGLEEQAVPTVRTFGR